MKNRVPERVLPEHLGIRNFLWCMLYPNGMGKHSEPCGFWKKLVLNTPVHSTINCKGGGTKCPERGKWNETKNTSQIGSNLQPKTMHTYQKKLPQSLWAYIILQSNGQIFVRQLENLKWSDIPKSSLAGLSTVRMVLFKKYCYDGTFLKTYHPDSIF